MLLLSVQIAELVATEFFEQGDKERRELNIEPSVSVSSLRNPAPATCVPLPALGWVKETISHHPTGGDPKSGPKSGILASLEARGLGSLNLCLLSL